MRVIAVQDSSQVGEARRAAVRLAQSHGFNEVKAGRVAIVCTELATNLVKHGGGGSLLVGSYDDETGTGLECLALDQGRGMEDVAACLRDGHSTAGTPGNGLSAIVRGADVSDIYSVPGKGTAILVRLASGTVPAGNRPRPARPSCGAVIVAMAGEEACGDSWCRKDWAAGGNQAGCMVMVADGLGHGTYAAEASLAAVRSFIGNAGSVPSELLAVMHGALRPTRGAAVSIARIDEAGGQVLFAGVGNVAAVIVDRTAGMRRLVCNNGTVGHIARHMRDFSYPVADAALLVLASDGLGTSWRVDAYPGLISRHPTLIAGVLYRDFARGRDDVTVVVCRMGTP